MKCVLLYTGFKVVDYVGVGSVSVGSVGAGFVGAGSVGIGSVGAGFEPSSVVALSLYLNVAEIE